jgi:integrase/recombinase XerD
VDDCGPDWFRGWVTGWRRSALRRAKAPTSLRTWSVYLRDFGSFLLDEEVLAPELLARDHLHRWQDGLRDRLAPASQVVAASAVRGLLKWADREELSTRPGLATWLDTPRVPESLPRALEQAELARILAHYGAARRDLVALRDRALFWFLATTGARISEALQVDVAQVMGGRVVVRKKGGGEHLLVPSERARQWVMQYLTVRGRDPEPALWIHEGPRGRRRLRPDQANEIWAALAEQLGVTPFTSHALRHTAVTELADRGVGDDDIRQQMGWGSPAMLSRYRKLRESRRQTIVDGLDDLVPELPPAAPRRRRRRYRVVDGRRPA